MKNFCILIENIIFWKSLKKLEFYLVKKENDEIVINLKKMRCNY